MSHLPRVDNALFSTDDEYSAPSPLPSPNEFSRLLNDPEFQTDINRRFARRPTTSCTLRFYQHISDTITQLEQEIERQKEERDYLWENLFNSRSFVGRIKPVMRNYRHKLALQRRGLERFRRTPTPYHVVPDNYRSMESIHVHFQRTPSPDYHTPTEEPENNDDDDSHLSLSDCDATRNVGPASEPDPTDTEDEGQGTSEYPRETDSPPPLFHSIVEPEPPIDETPPLCARCHIPGHDLFDCDTPIRSFTHCESCEWLGRPQENCNHFDVPPRFVTRFQFPGRYQDNEPH